MPTATPATRLPVTATADAEGLMPSDHFESVEGATSAFSAGALVKFPASGFPLQLQYLTVSQTLQVTGAVQSLSPVGFQGVGSNLTGVDAETLGGLDAADYATAAALTAGLAGKAALVHVHADATGAAAGFMPAADFTKLAAIGTDYVRFAAETATGGTGTAAAPYTHADNTGGIQTCVTALAARGGEVILSPGEYTVSTPILIRSSAIHVRGRAVGHGDGGNAEGEGEYGAKIALAAGTSGFRMGSTPSKPHAVTLERFYIYSPGKVITAPVWNSPFGPSGIVIDQYSDQFRILQVRFNNLPVGVLLTGVPDCVHVLNCDFIGCHVGVYYPTGYASDYNEITENVFSDIDSWGVNFDTDGSAGGATGTHRALIHNNEFIRCCRTATYAGTLFKCAFISFRTNEIFSDNLVCDTGKTLLGSLSIGADGLQLRGSYGTVTGNLILNHNESGFAGIRIFGHHYTVTGNTFNGNATDIILDAASADNRITQPGATVTDNGSRNIVNGTSKNVGDPDTTGAWNGVTKPDGTVIHDTSGGLTWLYHSSLTGGRLSLNSSAATLARYVESFCDTWTFTGGARTYGFTTTNDHPHGFYVHQGNANNTTDYMEGEVELAAGTYTLTVLSQKGNNRGLLKVEVNGVNLGNVDLYNAAAALNNQQDSIAGVVIATSGRQTIRLTKAGKNASSSSYFGTVTSVRLKV